MAWAAWPKKTFQRKNERIHWGFHCQRWGFCTENDGVQTEIIAGMSPPEPQDVINKNGIIINKKLDLAKETGGFINHGADFTSKNRDLI